MLLFALGTVGFLLFAPPLFLGLIPYKIITWEAKLHTFEIGAFRFIGIVPILVGILTYLWCAWSFTFSGRGTPLHILPPEKLVVGGLYRYVRNPMYVGACLILFGEALLFTSAGLLICASAMFALFNMFVYGEEARLRHTYGESYEQYCKSVPRWISRFKLFRGDISKSS